MVLGLIKLLEQQLKTRWRSKLELIARILTTLRVTSTKLLRNNKTILSTRGSKTRLIIGKPLIMELMNNQVMITAWKTWWA